MKIIQNQWFFLISTSRGKVRPTSWYLISRIRTIHHRNLLWWCIRILHQWRYWNRIWNRPITLIYSKALPPIEFHSNLWQTKGKELSNRNCIRPRNSWLIWIWNSKVLIFQKRDWIGIVLVHFLTLNKTKLFFKLNIAFSTLKKELRKIKKYGQKTMIRFWKIWIWKVCLGKSKH